MEKIRLQIAAELFGILFLFFHTFWHLIYLERSSYAVFLSFFLLTLLAVYSVLKHWEGWKAWGIRFDNFIESFKSAILPALLLIIACILYASVKKVKLLWPEWNRIIEYPISGFLQQLVVQGYFYNRYEAFTQKRRLAILLTAVTFSLVHLPNKALMNTSLLGGLYLSYFFSKHRNLFVVALLHGWMSLAFTFTLEPAGAINSYNVAPQPLGTMKALIHHSLTPDAKIGGYEDSSIPASFFDDFDRPVVVLHSHDEVEQLLNQRELVLIAIPKYQYDEITLKTKTPPYIWKESHAWLRKFRHQRSKTLKCILTLNFKKLDQLYREKVYLISNQPPRTV